jgi:hypothetical protein
MGPALGESKSDRIRHRPAIGWSRLLAVAAHPFVRLNIRNGRENDDRNPFS